jgi:hypothetical protein
MKRLLAAAALLIASPIAYGQALPLNCSPLVVEPNPTLAGTTVTATTTCTCFFPTESPVISRNGSEVVISYEASAICGVPPPPAPIQFNLGTFSPGEYTIVHAPVAEWGPSFETQEVLLGVQAHSIPSLGGVWTLAALLMALAAGLCHLTNRSSSFRP